ncbi:MAG TPA: sugar phosphate isomerase/epimerase family protein [Motilibacteraceae bacterium]|nr:sugar phosphate isomerase/epimerase family protein [Motilibacteraceae bacterium]
MSRGWRVLGADWNHWPDGLDDVATWELLARLGVAGVEVGVYVATVELSPGRTAERAEATERTGLPVASVLLSLPATRWPGGALTHPDPAVRERLVAEVTACAKAARALGLGRLGVWPGADLSDASWELLVDTLARARDAASAHDVWLDVEYKPGTVVPDCTAALHLAGDVPGTGVLLDTGHAWALGEDPAESVRRLGPLLTGVHLGDANPGRSDDDLPLGRVHDVAALVRALDETGYAGTAAFDLYGAVSEAGQSGESAVAESLAALRGAGWAP